MLGCVSSKSLVDGVPAFPAPVVSSWLMTTTLTGERRRRGIAFARSGPASEPMANEPATPAAPLRKSPRESGLSSMGFDMLPYDKEKGYRLVDRLREIGTAYAATPAQVALAWILSKPFVGSVLLGANKFTQLEDNLGAADLEIRKEDLASLDELTAPTPAYPNFFIDRVVDEPVRQALRGLGRSSGSSM